MKLEFSSRCEPSQNAGTPSFLLILVAITISIGFANAQDLYLYPTKGQSQAQQDKDRYECHTWAVQQTGFDPSAQQTRASSASESTQQYQPSQRHVLKGAGRGAAMGAVGGAIAGDAGKGAAAGAAMGGLAGGFRRRDERRQQANAQVTNANVAAGNQRTAYNRAMAACLQGRGYTVN
jgi:hypothetical protein